MSEKKSEVRPGKSSAQETAVKKPVAKRRAKKTPDSKSTSQTARAKKSTGKKSAPRKAASRKAAIKSASNRSASRESSATKTTVKRAVAKKTVAKRAGVKKAAAKKASSKKATAKHASSRKAASPKRARDLHNDLERRLNEQRQEIMNLFRQDLGVGSGGSLSHEGEDDVDRANFDFSRELALSLSNGEREVLMLISEALDRIAQGVYGDCSNCSQSIADARLEAIPWARHCVDCQELEEKGLLSA